MKISLFRILLGLATLPFPLSGQNCGTDALEAARKNDPVYRSARLETEARIRASVRTGAAQKQAGAPDVYIIPVVVHVIHDGVQDDVSIDDSVTYAQVASQFPLLNQAYRQLPGTLSGGIGADARMEFHLATKDPSGNPTTGITYHVSDETFVTGDGEDSLVKIVQWDPKRYVNVYLVADIADTGTVIINGYATLPVAGGPDIDRIVIRNTRWGSLNTAAGGIGTTGIHEFGHYFGLYHTFENGCNPAGDGCEDTPPQARSAPLGGPNRENSCTVGSPDLPDPENNYMDYIDELSRNVFTSCQVARMHATLNDPQLPSRNQLWSDANLAAAGVGPAQPPVAVFRASDNQPCLGGTFQLTDYSQNVPTSWRWTVSGGSPPTSLTFTDQHPTLSLTAPGTYDVKLVVGNASGKKDSVAAHSILKVVSRQPLTVYPYTEAFSAQSTLTTSWQVDNPDSAFRYHFTFEYSPLNGADGKPGYVTVNAFAYPNISQRDGLHTPPFDLRKLTHPWLRFYRAYRPYADGPSGYTFTDTLSIYARSGCDGTQVRLFHLGGAGLATVQPPFTAELSNPASAWKLDSISLEGFKADSSVRLRFEFLNGWGNNFFLDEVQVQDGPMPQVGVAELQTTDLEAVWPNPFTDKLQVGFSLAESGPVELSLYDLQGRKLATHLEEGVAGHNILSWDIRAFCPSPGAYLLTASAGERQFHRKVFFQP